MAPIFEPVTAIWSVPAKGRALRLTANAEDRNVTVARTNLSESIELSLDQLAELEAALLNARLWLERAIAQRDELRAAEEIADDPLCVCGHRQSLHAWGGPCLPGVPCPSGCGQFGAAPAGFFS